MSLKTPLEKEIRKSRKKLRQIDHLLHVDRNLNDEELIKVSQKEEIQDTLQELLEEYGDDNLNNGNNGSSVVNSSASFTSEPSWQSTEQKNDDTFCLSPVMSDCGDLASDNDVSESLDVTRGISKKEPIDTKPKSQAYAESKDTEAYSGDKPLPRTVPKKFQVEPKTKAKTVVKPKPVTDWRSKKYTVRELCGHNDLVMSVAVDGEHIMTGSRDTMVKTWTMSGVELHSFGAHSGTVTAVEILNKQASQYLCEHWDGELEVPFECSEKIGLSGSQDCCIKIWALLSGQLLKDVYTFNAVTAVNYLEQANLIVSSSDGGKVQLWDPFTGTAVYEVLAHQDSITSLRVSDNMVYTASSDGDLRCFEYVSDTKKLRQVFCSENKRHRFGGDVIERSIHDMASCDSMLYFGDDGVNVKALQWKDGIVHKIANHKSGFGATHCIATSDDLLFTSGHELDTGQGCIHVRRLPSEDYLCTLCDPSLGRIVCMACLASKTRVDIVLSSAKRVYVWSCTKDTKSTDASVTACMEAQYWRDLDVTPIDSAAESSDDDESDAEATPGSRGGDVRTRSSGAGAQTDADRGAASNWWWCSIL